MAKIQKQIQSHYRALTLERIKGARKMLSLRRIRRLPLSKKSSCVCAAKRCRAATDVNSAMAKGCGRHEPVLDLLSAYEARLEEPSGSCRARFPDHADAVFRQATRWFSNRRGRETWRRLSLSGNN